MKKTYVSPRIAVLRRSLNVMAGLDLYSQVGIGSGGQLGNEAIMDDAGLPQAKSVWE